ncbi:hypothetical protein D9613_005272 [Agrocybe pediades]|uniref:Ubiquitin carboxyl-terminal hydrolase n=1 Tax=Agrocybe pediades TaxID=84607 RepID=A0A8H4QXV3_9AGAR|nr:hypothetical protein D9613_005272 [Agrocybe pediades]
MMLASPYLPGSLFSSQSNNDDALHYRPSKDMEAFNSLLPPPIEFVEGSSSGTLAVAEGKYEPINASPKPGKAELPDSSKPSRPVPVNPVTPSSRPTQHKSLHPAPIDMSWPPAHNLGVGLYNTGNSCFLNSALQCLLHTPPLLKLLQSHKREECPLNNKFCMTCSLKNVAHRAHTSKGSFTPSLITNNLQVIAKHMRKGRQEDSHEFLRYAIDSLQKSCLTGHPPKLDTKIAETTWVHKLFGGRLRSRVTCKDCGHNSDTFDRILDLSLDISRCDSLKDALRKFIAIDYLKGADKYKCEKCKKPVNAEKSFSIHEAPLVLTVHLKRFSPLGRKLTHPIQFDQQLQLQPYMSKGQFGPTYSLYGVICHAGSGPNSGHYYAYVKSREGRWFEMNDESVSSSGLPTDKRNAYMLFYIQDKGQGLEAAVQAPILNPSQIKNGLASGMKKKVQKPLPEEDDEDRGEKVSAPLIGPLLPPPAIISNSAVKVNGSREPIDPQALTLKSKIAQAAQKTPSKALENLGQYASDDDDENEPPAAEPSSDKMVVDSKGKPESKSLSSSSAPKQDSLPVPTSSAPPSSPIPASSFYGSSKKSNKRKFTENSSEPARAGSKFSAIQASTKGYVTSNPYNYQTKAAKRKRMGI